MGITKKKGGLKMENTISLKVRFDEKEGRRKEGSNKEKRIIETAKAIGIRDYNNPYSMEWIPKSGIESFDGEVLRITKFWVEKKIFPSLPQFAERRVKAFSGEVVEI
jgi:hypothetical protein